MVRAGVVSHPKEWEWSGYNEIQSPKDRYTIIDHRTLQELLRRDSHKMLKKDHQDWIEEALDQKNSERDCKWTESIAVGTKPFVEKVKEQLGFRAGRKKIHEVDGTYQLREPEGVYDPLDGSMSNAFPWDISDPEDMTIS